jgi:hypothetical protein
MRALMTLLMTATVLAGCGAPRNLLAPAAQAPTNVRLASVQPQALQVQRTPETASNLIGAFNLINSNRSSEVLRFYGSRTTVSKATVQNGASAARAISPAEATAYGQLLAKARPDQATSELRSLLAAWASKKATTSAATLRR